MFPLIEVLDLARWAPSGDNTQPWRFAIDGAANSVTVFGHDTRLHCVYDLDGRPSQISLGALLETIALAATRFGLTTQMTRRQGSTDERPVFDVVFSKETGLAEHSLVKHIVERRVQRRKMKLRRLAQQEKALLGRAVEPSHRLAWVEGSRDRAQRAWLDFV